MISFIIIYSLIFFLIYNRGFGSLILPIFVLSLIAGARGNVGYDTCTYKTIFSDIFTGQFPFLEPGFVVFTSFARLISDQPQFFLAFVAMVEGYLLYLMAKKNNNAFLFLTGFVAVFYYPFFFTTLRNGIAFMLVGLAYVVYLQNRRILVAPLVIAPLFHVTSFPALLVFSKIGIFGAVVYALSNVFPLSIESIGSQLGFNFAVFEAKFDGLALGAYRRNEFRAMHIYIFAIYTQVLILLTVKDWYSKIALSLLITVSVIADGVFGLVGRVQVFGIFAMLIYNCNYWNKYSRIEKILLIINYLYYSYTYSGYSILRGDEVLANFAEFIDTTAGSYYIWLFNDASSCAV